MYLTMLKSKLHRVTVTMAALDYVGSITIDRALMDAAGLVEYQQVQVADVDNGARLETYVIAGERGSGIICMNGAAARCVSVGDKIIVMAYCALTPAEAEEHRPTVVFVDDQNQVRRVARYEAHGRLTDCAVRPEPR